MLDRILKRTINGGEYTITPLASAAGGLATYRKLHKYLGPIVGTLMKVAVVGMEGTEETGAVLMQMVVTHLSEAMGDAEFCAILDKMFSTCAYNGGAIPANHWDTHLADHDELAACCLWVNYLLPFAEPKLRLVGIDLGQLLGQLKLRPISTRSTLVS